jgi:predicted nucleic acid-binding protein
MATRSAASRKVPPKPTLIVLDSSCWIEYLRDSPRAAMFAEAAETSDRLVVPIITVYEVTKKLHRELSAKIAAYAEAVMCRGTVVDVDLELSRAAARMQLPLADSLIYATAQLHDAMLWTQDAHFDGLAGVKYFAKT